MPFANPPECVVVLTFAESWESLSDQEQDLLFQEAEDLIQAHLVWQDLERRFGPKRR